MQAILVVSTTNNFKQLQIFCEQFKNSNINVYIYNSNFSILKKRELEQPNIIFLSKTQIIGNIEYSLLNLALKNTKNTYFHLFNEYSFIFPNLTKFNIFFNNTKSNYISDSDLTQWSITRFTAEYILVNYKKEEHIISIIKDNDKFDNVGNNLRFKGEPLSVLNLREYIEKNILNYLILHNIDCSQIGYEQILKQLKYIYSTIPK